MFLDDNNPPPYVKYDSPVTYEAGLSIVPNIPESFGSPISRYSVSPALPNGLFLDTTTGIISGSPADSAGPMNYLISVLSAGGSKTFTVNITVVDNRVGDFAPTQVGNQWVYQFDYHVDGGYIPTSTNRHGSVAILVSRKSGDTVFLDIHFDLIEIVTSGPTSDTAAIISDRTMLLIDDGETIYTQLYPNPFVMFYSNSMPLTPFYEKHYMHPSTLGIAGNDSAGYTYSQIYNPGGSEPAHSTVHKVDTGLVYYSYSRRSPGNANSSESATLTSFTKIP